MFRHDSNRHLVLDKRVQYRHAMTGIIVICVTVVVLSVPFIPLLQAIHILMDGEPEYVNEVIQDKLDFARLTFVLGVCGLAAGVALLSVRRARRFAGPTYRLTRFIEGLTAGEFKNRFTVRYGDGLQSVAEALNEMLNRYQKREETMRQRVVQVVHASRPDDSTGERADRAAHALDHVFDGKNDLFSFEDDISGIVSEPVPQSVALEEDSR